MSLKKHFIKDEKEGISAYEKALNKAKGREKKVYKKILPQEKHHLQELKEI
jgi:rubrerythrin